MLQKRQGLEMAVLTVLLMLKASPGGAVGINLSWDDCGDNGVASKTWACDSNAGTPQTLIGSFVAPPGVGEFLGLSADISITAQSGVLPDWWKHGTGECRGTTGLAANFDFTAGSGMCSDVIQGQAVGGWGYTINAYGAGAQLRVQCAVPFDNRAPLDSLTEYYAFKVLLQHGKSTGTGSCAGCSQPVILTLTTLQLFQPPARLFDPILTVPLTRTAALWQVSTSITPVHRATMGQVLTRFR